MDEVIFESSRAPATEIHLTVVFMKAVFPPSSSTSGTRREGCCWPGNPAEDPHPASSSTTWTRSRPWNGAQADAATKNNNEFFDMMRRGGYLAGNLPSP
jgi:hypothetical protein